MLRVHTHSFEKHVGRGNADGGAERTQKHLIGVQPEEQHQRQHEHCGERRLDDVPMAVVEQRIDAGRLARDPDVAVQPRVGKQRVIVVDGVLEAAGSEIEEQRARKDDERAHPDARDRRCRFQRGCDAPKASAWRCPRRR